MIINGTLKATNDGLVFSNEMLAPQKKSTMTH
jgi:hypothetical protein